MSNELALVDATQRPATAISLRDDVQSRIAVAEACRAIIESNVMSFGNSKYLKADGVIAAASFTGLSWQTRVIESTPQGIVAVCDAVRVHPDGRKDLFSAEGFVGPDEVQHWGGERIDRMGKKEIYPPKPMSQVRSLAQTRATRKCLWHAVGPIANQVVKGISPIDPEEIQTSQIPRPKAKDWKLLQSLMAQAGVEGEYMEEKFGPSEDFTMEIHKAALVHLRDLIAKNEARKTPGG